MSENLFNNPVIVNQSMAADVISDVSDLSKIDGFAAYAKWTGSPVGIIQLEVSVTDDPNDMVVLDGSQTTVNGAGNALWEVDTSRYDKVRIHFVRTSGTGTLNGQINGKGDFR